MAEHLHLHSVYRLQNRESVYVRLFLTHIIYIAGQKIYIVPCDKIYLLFKQEYVDKLAAHVERQLAVIVRAVVKHEDDSVFAQNQDLCAISQIFCFLNSLFEHHRRAGIVCAVRDRFCILRAERGRGFLEHVASVNHLDFTRHHVV